MAGDGEIAFDGQSSRNWRGQLLNGQPGKTPRDGKGSTCRQPDGDPTIIASGQATQILPGERNPPDSIWSTRRFGKYTARAPDYRGDRQKERSGFRKCYAELGCSKG